MYKINCILSYFINCILPYYIYKLYFALFYKLYFMKHIYISSWPSQSGSSLSLIPSPSSSRSSTSGIPSLSSSWSTEIDFLKIWNHFLGIFLGNFWSTEIDFLKIWHHFLGSLSSSTPTEIYTKLRLHHSRVWCPSNRIDWTKIGRNILCPIIYVFQLYMS